MPFKEFIDRLDDYDFGEFFYWYGIPLPKVSQLPLAGNLRDFCQFVIDSIHLPVIQPTFFLDQHCDSAGLFLAIKRQLVERGACEESIGPSTALLPFVKSHRDYFAMLRWCDRDRMPVPIVLNSLLSFGCIAYFVIVILSVVSLSFGNLGPQVAFATTCLVALSPVIVLAFFVLIERFSSEKYRLTSYGRLSDFRSLVSFILNRKIDRSTLACHTH